MALKKANKMNMFIGLGIILAAFVIAIVLWSLFQGDISLGRTKRGQVNMFLWIPVWPTILLYVAYYLRRQKDLSSVVSAQKRDLKLPFAVISSVVILAILFIPMVAISLSAAAAFFGAMAGLLVITNLISYFVLFPK